MFNDSLVDGLAWDWVNRKLYWTDAEDKDIEVIDALNGQRKLLVSMENTTIPRAIVVDPKNRYVIPGTKFTRHHVITCLYFCGNDTS